MTGDSAVANRTTQITVRDDRGRPSPRHGHAPSATPWTILVARGAPVGGGLPIAALGLAHRYETANNIRARGRRSSWLEVRWLLMRWAGW